PGRLMQYTFPPGDILVVWDDTDGRKHWFQRMTLTRDLQYEVVWDYRDTPISDSDMDRTVGTMSARSVASPSHANAITDMITDALFSQAASTRKYERGRCH